MQELTQSQWLVMVMTSPGRPTPTLQKCVDSIGRAGFNRFVISEDPEYRPEIATCGEFSREITPGAGAIGPWPHMLYMLDRAREAYAAGMRGQWQGLLIVQDDVILPRDLGLWLIIHPEWRLQRHMASLWLPSFYNIEQPYKDICNAEAQPEDIEWWSLGRHDLPRRVYGALAVLMTWPVAGELLEWGRWEQGMTKADYRLGEFCKETGHTWLYPTRSLVSHLGDSNSTLGETSRQKVYTLATNPVKDCLIDPAGLE